MDEYRASNNRSENLKNTVEIHLSGRCADRFGPSGKHFLTAIVLHLCKDYIFTPTAQYI